jgi:hypothetical protein
MKKEALKRIFEFIKEKEGHNLPFLWKLMANEPLTEEDLNVKGDLDFSQSEIESLPEGLKISGDLDLSFSKIMLLPKGLKVGGHLDLTETDIEFLPKGLEVGGYLAIRYTKITSLPKGLEVGATLYIKNTALLEYTDEELKEMVKPGILARRIYRE